MKKQIFLILMVLFPFCIASIAATPEEITEKSLLSRKDIIKKDEERRAKILKKFSDFQAKVKNFAPDLKINIPVNSLTPNPDTPKTGEANNTTIESKENTKNSSMKFVVCPKDKNKK